MLDLIVRYLHESQTPFRLASYPSVEHMPSAAHAIPHHGVLVESQLVLIGDRLALVAFPADQRLDFAALSNELGQPVSEASPEDLPEDLSHFTGAPPPLGQLLGLPLIVDEAIASSAVIVFSPFGESAYFEVPYDDFARQEQPKVASLVRAGELPPARRPGASPPT